MHFVLYLLLHEFNFDYITFELINACKSWRCFHGRLKFRFMNIQKYDSTLICNALIIYTNNLCFFCSWFFLWCLPWSFYTLTPFWKLDHKFVQNLKFCRFQIMCSWSSSFKIPWKDKIIKQIERWKWVFS